jgi:hypothetical protein
MTKWFKRIFSWPHDQALNLNDFLSMLSQSAMILHQDNCKSLIWKSIRLQNKASGEIVQTSWYKPLFIIISIKILCIRIKAESLESNPIDDQNHQNDQNHQIPDFFPQISHVYPFELKLFEI